MMQSSKPSLHRSKQTSICYERAVQVTARSNGWNSSKRSWKFSAQVSFLQNKFFSLFLSCFLSSHVFSLWFCNDPNLFLSYAFIYLNDLYFCLIKFSIFAWFKISYELWRLIPWFLRISLFCFKFLVRINLTKIDCAPNQGTRAKYSKLRVLDFRKKLASGLEFRDLKF